MLLFKGLFYMCLLGISWTIYGYVAGKAPKIGIPMSALLLGNAVVSLLVFGCVCWRAGLPPTDAPVGLTAALLVLCGLCNYFQLDIMAVAMARGPNGLIWALIQSGLVFPFLVGVLFFGSRVTVLNTFGVAAVVAGILLQGRRKGDALNGKWLLPALLAFVVTGVTQVTSNMPSYLSGAESIESCWRSLYFTMGLGGGMLLKNMLWEDGSRRRQTWAQLAHGRTWGYALALGVVDILGSLFVLYRGMDALAQAGVGAIAYPVAVAASIIAFELYAIVCLREKRSGTQRMALLLLLIGAVCLSC